MWSAIQYKIRRWATRVPYPLALQSLLSLVLLATLPSALEAAGWALSPRFALLCALIGLYLAVCWVVPARQLRFWPQLAYLSLQVGVASLAHVIMPSHLLGYLYLLIVLQAVYLFKPLLWIAFASAVYIIWSGGLMIASANLIDWVRGNLMLAFPVLCILVAAAVYARQHQRHEHVQHVLQQMQHHYDTLLLRLRDAPERAAREERDRLAQTIASDITAALAQTEQSIASAISQAQTNLARLDATVAQTRAAAAATIERMRAAVSSLRLGARDDPTPGPQPPLLVLPPDELMTARGQRTLSWSLPLAFVAVALPLALLQRSLAPTWAALFALCCAGLIGGYVFTQRIRTPPLVLLGLLGQVLAVLGMVAVTHALPLMLGLLLVMWQTAMRLPAGQIVTFLVGTQALIGLALVRVIPLPSVDGAQLLIFCVTCLAVTILIGTARRQLSRRRQDEARLARLTHLSGELEQQLSQVRVLATAVERTRLAREIHDDLGHRLMLLNVHLQLVEDLIADDPGAALEQLSSTREQLHDAWSSVLGAADAVLAIDGATLAPALARLVNQCRTLTSMHIDLRIIGELTYVDPAVACTIYRAVQEGLTNACKHARQARSTQVQVYCDDVELQVRVRDDGCGDMPTCAAPRLPADGHFGLAGLRERAALLGGAIQAGPHLEGGFALIVTIPLP